jgi:hypothetical protein
MAERNERRRKEGSVEKKFCALGAHPKGDVASRSSGNQRLVLSPHFVSFGNANRGWFPG